MKTILKTILILLAYTSHAQYAIEYKFDELQRTKEEKYPDGTIVTYTYDPVSNRKTKVVNRVVAGQPDITLVNSSLSVSSIVVGNNLTVSTTVSNLQTTAANPNFKIKYYLSDNNLYEATDTELGAFQTITAPFTSTQNLQNLISIPVGQIGNKYIIIRADADYEVTNEVSETNNEVALPIKIIAPCGIISIVVNTTNATNGNANGSATATASGGSEPYEFLWNNGATTSIINNLSTGNYSVSVTDANDCQGAGSGVVTNLNVCNLVVTANTIDATCISSDGAIDLSVSGGAMPYSYIWSNGASTQDLVNVASNDYYVEITDANQCKTIANFWVGIKGVVVSMDTIKLAQKIFPSYLNVQYSLLENTNSTKLILSDFLENTGTLNFQAVNLLTKTNETLLYAHPSGGKIKKWGISSIGDTLILLNHHIINGIPEGANLTQFKMINGQLSMLKDLKYVNYQWYVDENIRLVYPSLYIKTFKNKAFVFSKSNQWTGTNGSVLGWLDGYDLNSGNHEAMQFHEIWPLNENSFVKDNTKNNRFLSIVSKISSTNPKIGVHEVWDDGTIPDYTVRPVKKIPFHIQTTKHGIFILSISKTLDSLFIESYDKDFNLLNFSFLTKRRTITAVAAGYSTSGKSILSIIGTPDGSPNSKILFWDCENHKVISDQNYYWGNSSDREDGIGLFYSNNLNKFYSIHKKWKYQSLGPIDENRLVSFQIMDGVSIQTQISDTPYGTNSGSINLTISGGTATYLWSNGATTEDVSNLGEGNYSVTITPTGGGCPIVRSFQIKTNTAPTAPTVSSNPSPAIIISGSNNTVTLTASNCGGIIQWSTGETAASFTVAPSTTTSYSATCTYNNFTSPSSLLVTVSVIAPTQAPIISTTKTEICIGESITLFASNCSGTVTWNNTLGTGSSKIVIPIINTTYTAYCSLNGNTSVNSNELVIFVNAIPKIKITTLKNYIRSGEPIVLNATLCNGVVSWNNGFTGSSITVNPTVSTIYSASCSVNGCTSDLAQIPIIICNNIISLNGSSTILERSADKIISSENLFLSGKNIYKFSQSVEIKSPFLFQATNTKSFETKTEGCGLSRDLISFYKFNGNANDESGNNNHGTPIITNEYYKGIDSLSIKINGSGNVGANSSHIILPNPMNNINTNYTLSVWVKEDAMSYPHGEGYIFFGDHLGQHIGISHFLDNLEFLNAKSFNASSGRIVIPFQKRWIGVFNHYVMTFKDNTLICFINGQKVGEQINVETVTTDNNAGMGVHWFLPNMSTRLIGSFDNTRIYQRAMSDIEVLNLFNTEKPVSQKDIGMMIYLPFNGNANDESGNGNNGIINGATLTTDRFGNEGKAYKFNGIDSWIEVPHSNSLNCQKLTISAWVQPNGWYAGTCKANFILTKGFDSEQNYSMYYNGDTPDACNGNIQNVTMQGWGGQWIKSTTPNNSIKQNQWVHIVGIYDGDEMKIYQNGQLISSSPFVANLIPNNKNLFIGRNATGNPLSYGYPYFANAKIDDIRIYNRTLDAVEISQLYNSEKPIPSSDSLAAYYPLNGNTNDESGFNRILTNTNAILTTDRKGQTNSAYYFNGNAKLVSENVSYLHNTSFTINFWMKPDEYTTLMAIRMGEPAFNAALHIALRDANTLTFAFYANDYDINNFKKDGQWHHYSLVYDKESGLKKIYEDGVLLGTAVCNTPLYVENTPLRIGQTWDGQSSSFRGALDEVRIYRKVLTESEILDIYNSEKP